MGIAEEDFVLLSGIPFIDPRGAHPTGVPPVGGDYKNSNWLGSGLVWISGF